jgi:hypothetical protein
MTKVIQFPGAKAPVEKPSDQMPVLPVDLNADQQKAIGIILSGQTFICIGIDQPASGGADFFTACHGDEGYLRNAEDHLPAVIHRLLVRKGIVS